jgi:hypothetical protein
MVEMSAKLAFMVIYSTAYALVKSDREKNLNEKQRTNLFAVGQLSQIGFFSK